MSGETRTPERCEDCGRVVALENSTGANLCWEGAGGPCIPESPAELRADVERLEANLGNLLAVIHRDGGHHQARVGTEQACLDAAAVWHERGAEVDRLTASPNPLVAEMAEEVAALEASLRESISIIERLTEQGKQDAAVIDGFAGDLARVRAEQAEADKAEYRNISDGLSARLREAQGACERNREDAVDALAEAAQLRERVAELEAAIAECYGPGAEDEVSPTAQLSSPCCFRHGDIASPRSPRPLASSRPPRATKSATPKTAPSQSGN